MVMSMIALMIAVIPIAIEVADISSDDDADAAIMIALFSPYSQEKVKITTLLSDYHHAP